MEEFIEHYKFGYKIERNIPIQYGIASGIKIMVIFGYIDFTMNAFNILEDDRVIETSYPLMKSEFCFILPVEKEIPLYMYLVLPFQTEVWIVIVIFIFYMTIMLHLATILKMKQADFGESLMQVIGGMLFIGFTTDFRRVRHLRIYLIYAVIGLTGFILTNIYLALSTSFFSKIMYEPEVNSLEGMVENDVKIMLDNCGRNLQVIKDFYKIPPNFDKIIIKVDDYTLSHSTIELKTNSAFLDSMDDMEIILQQQRLLKRKLYRVSNMCVGSFHVAFALRNDSILLEPLKLFIMRIQQSGLSHHWKSTAYNELKDIGILKDFQDFEDDGPKVLEFSHLTILWYTWTFGISLSVCCFIIENYKYVLKIMSYLGLKVRRFWNATRNFFCMTWSKLKRTLRIN